MILSAFALAAAESDPSTGISIAGIVGPKRIALTDDGPSVTKPVVIIVENQTPHTKVVPDAAALGDLIGLESKSFGAGSTVAPTLVPPKSFPITLWPGRKLAVVFTATFGRADSPGDLIGFRQTALIGHSPVAPTQAESAITLAYRSAQAMEEAARASSPSLRALQPASVDGAYIVASPTTLVLKAGQAESGLVTLIGLWPGHAYFVSFDLGTARIESETQYTATCRFTQPGQYTLGGYFYDPKDTKIQPNVTVTINVVQVTFQNVQGARIGVTTPAADRSQMFQAAVNPASLASDVKLQISAGDDRLAFKGTPASTGTGFNFAIEGIGATGSAAMNDCTIVATAGGAVAAEAKVTVIVPKKIVSQDTGARQDYNYLAYESDGRAPGSSPAYSPGPGQPHVVFPMALERTIHSFPVTVHVADQFGNPVGDLYSGAKVFEVLKTGASGINQTLAADSTYLDPAGIAGRDWNPNRAPVQLGTAAASNFLSAPPLFPIAPNLIPKGLSSTAIDTPPFTVHIDAFPLSPPIARTFLIFSNGTIQLKQTPPTGSAGAQ